MDGCEFLRRVSMGILAGSAVDRALAAGWASAEATDEPKPNVLFATSDDQSWSHTVAELPEYAKAKKKLGTELGEFIADTKDPRALGEVPLWDTCRYYGRAKRK